MCVCCIPVSQCTSGNKIKQLGRRSKLSLDMYYMSVVRCDPICLPYFFLIHLYKFSCTLFDIHCTLTHDNGIIALMYFLYLIIHFLILSFSHLLCTYFCSWAMMISQQCSLGENWKPCHNKMLVSIFENLFSIDKHLHPSNVCLSTNDHKYYNFSISEFIIVLLNFIKAVGVSDHVTFNNNSLMWYILSIPN